MVMVKFMKISTTNRLGMGYVNRGNALRMEKAAAKRFALTKKEIVNNNVVVSNVNDKLGLVMSTVALGDEIASTIRTGMNVCALDFSAFTNEDGVLGENAKDIALIYAATYWEAYDRETKELNMAKAEEIVENRRGMVMEPIYLESDITLATNKFDMQRFVYGVNDYYFRRAEAALASINPETTLEELELFQRQFGFLTRGLGEQTIDVTKHVDYVFYTTMKKLISGYIPVVGGIKELQSNIKTYRRTKEEYSIFVNEEPRANTMARQMDVIGQFKQVSADTMESSMREFIEILSNECNYDNYKQYEDIDIMADANYYVLACLIDSVSDAVMNMETEDRERALAGIYNAAEELGIEREMVFKIAMKLSISEPRQKRNGSLTFIPVLGTDKEYKADIWRVAMLFGDIFVAQYAGKDIIEVPVKYETEIDIEAGEIIEITNGYGYGGMLRIISPFQNGKVKVVDNGVVALYNPLETLLNKYPNAIAIPVDSYAKETCRFGAWTPAKIDELEDTDENGKTAVVGYEAAKDSIGLRIARNNDMFCIIAVGKNNTMTAAAIAADSFTNKRNDFVVKDAVCYKSLIVANYTAVK